MIYAPDERRPPKTKTEPFDFGRLLDREEDVQAYLADAEESGDAAYIAHAQEVAKQVRERIARDTAADPS